MENEEVKIEDNVHIILRDENGNIKDERHIHNTLTTYGKEGLADLILASPAVTKPGWMAIGTGTPAATLLGAENARVAFTSKTRSGAVVTMIGTYAAGTGTGTIIEAGLFDVVTANTVNMWASTTFGAITKGALDSLEITWTITQA